MKMHLLREYLAQHRFKAIKCIHFLIDSCQPGPAAATSAGPRAVRNPEASF